MIQIALYVAVFAVLYVVMILPQQRRRKEAAAMLAAIEPGDEIVMTSGIHGFVNSLDEDVIWVEVAEDLELKVSRTAVAQVLRTEEPTNVEGD